jgi:hypothetical protein
MDGPLQKPLPSAVYVVSRPLRDTASSTLFHGYFVEDASASESPLVVLKRFNSLPLQNSLGTNEILLLKLAGHRGDYVVKLKEVTSRVSVSGEKLESWRNPGVFVWTVLEKWDKNLRSLLNTLVRSGCLNARMKQTLCRQVAKTWFHLIYCCNFACYIIVYFARSAS